MEETTDVKLNATWRGGGGNSLAVQWLGLRAFTAGGPGSIPGEGSKILKTAGHSQGRKIDDR